MRVVQHPELRLELGLVEDVAQQGEVGGDLGGLGHSEVVGQLKLVDHSESYKPTLEVRIKLKISLDNLSFTLARNQPIVIFSSTEEKSTVTITRPKLLIS